jgi:hypothetical protein
LTPEFIPVFLLCLFYLKDGGDMFNDLRGVISQKTVLFVTTGVRNSIPTSSQFITISDTLEIKTSALYTIYESNNCIVWDIHFMSVRSVWVALS